MNKLLIIFITVVNCKIQPFNWKPFTGITAELQPKITSVGDNIKQWGMFDDLSGRVVMKPVTTIQNKQATKQNTGRQRFSGLRRRMFARFHKAVRN